MKVKQIAVFDVGKAKLCIAADRWDDSLSNNIHGGRFVFVIRNY